MRRVLLMGRLVSSAGWRPESDTSMPLRRRPINERNCVVTYASSSALARVRLHSFLLQQLPGPSCRCNAVTRRRVLLLGMAQAALHRGEAQRPAVR